MMHTFSSQFHSVHSIAFHTLGCKVNFAETSFLSNDAEEHGYMVVPFRSKADVYIIHSCILTSQAEKKTRYSIAQAHRRNPDARIIVMGCLSQLKADELLKIPGVVAVQGNSSKFNLEEVLQKIDANQSILHFEDDMHSNPDFRISFSTNDRTRSFLKVQDGCDCYCAYCIVPYARGKSRSATLDEVLQSLEIITKKGFKEVVLTGINLGDFGKYTNQGFSQLLQTVGKHKEIQRIRISSLEPHHFTDELFEVLKSEQKIMPHFHIPIQAGDDKTLSRMGRTYSTEQIRTICDRLNDTSHSVCIAADVITGFPGETDDHFRSGLEFLESLPLAYMHVFTYSSRSNTRAASMSGHISAQEKKKRTTMMLQLSQKMKIKFYQSNFGSIHPVLIESDIKNELMYGFTDNYIRVRIPVDKHLTGKIVNMKLTHFIESEEVFEGEIVNA